MTIVVVESKEAEGDGGRLAVLVPEKDLWAFQVLCARAGQKILREEDEDAS
jgi:hypothetical protein